MHISDSAQLWTDALLRMRARIHATDERVTDGFPYYADAQSGVWTTSPNGAWTGGHWVGELWLAGRDDEGLRSAASRWSHQLRARLRSRTIFRSFLFYYGAALGDIICSDAQARELALEAAREFTTSFNRGAGVFPLEGASGKGEASIDAVGAICGLLCWATEVSGERKLRSLARDHALRHIDWCVREDGSVLQSASFDPVSGKLVRRYAENGYFESSIWARAQAWGLLAFTMAAHWLPEDAASFLPVARRIANWWIAHTPAEDPVAYWDFDDPAIPNTYRDTSATAIATAALLKLAALDGEHSAATYRNHAQLTAKRLVTAHLTAAGILADGCYNPKLGRATSNELIWGDYYLFEALNVLSGALAVQRV